MSWECFVKNGGVRSSLIECQFFLNSKMDVDPICCVLTFFHALCMTLFSHISYIWIFVTLTHRINRQEEYCLFLSRIFDLQVLSRVDDRMKIKRTSDVVNILGESALDHHIVMYWKINKIASWMSLKSSEINNYSWTVSAVLIFPFCSPSCCQACFPSIDRSMRNLWELTLKLFFNFPEMNRSIFFSMYFAMNDEEDMLLLSILHYRRQDISLFQCQSNSFS